MNTQRSSVHVESAITLSEATIFHLNISKMNSMNCSDVKGKRDENAETTTMTRVYDLDTH